MFSSVALPKISSVKPWTLMSKTSHVYCSWFFFFFLNCQILMKTLALQGRCSESHLTGGVWKHFTLCSAYYLCFQNQKKKSDATCTACQAAKSLKPKLTISSTCDPPYWNEIMSAEVTIDYLLPWGGETITFLYMCIVDKPSVNMFQASFEIQNDICHF